MSIQEFKTVDIDSKAKQYKETNASLVIDKNGNLIFFGFAYDNLVKGSPLMKIENRTIQYVLSEPEFKVIGRIAEEWRDCVRLKCYAALTGWYGPMRHDYFWFDVDKSTWQRLWEFCIRPVNGKPNMCRATIAQNIDFHSQEQVGSNRSASIALSSQNPYLVLGAKGPRLSFKKDMSQEAEFRAKVESVHQFYASQIAKAGFDRRNSPQLFKQMFETLYRYDTKQNKWVDKSLTSDKRYYIEMYLYICYYLKDINGGVPIIVFYDQLQRQFATQDQIAAVEACFKKDEERFKALFLSMWIPYIKDDE
jgi:hypothetical protein